MMMDVIDSGTIFLISRFTSCQARGNIETLRKVSYQVANVESTNTPAPASVEPLAISVIARELSAELDISSGQIARTVELLDEGNTLPFIARYRKEVTGSLDEVQIQAIADRTAALRALHERKADVHRLIEAQGKMTPELAAAIAAATTLQEVEDLYLPYRPKRKTRASVAREKGLAPLADLILQQVVKP